MLTESEATRARWLAAADAAARIPDNGSDAKLWRVLTVASVATVVIAGIILWWRQMADADGPVWVDIVLSAAPFGLALVGLVGLIVWSARSGNLWHPSVLEPLRSSERKSVRRQVAGKSPVDTSHLPVALGYARQVRRNALTQVPIMLMFVVIYSNMIETDWTQIGWSQILFAISAVALVVVMVLTIVTFRRAGRFLRRWTRDAGATARGNSYS